jgi:hypothetical protein
VLLFAKTCWWDHRFIPIIPRSVRELTDAIEDVAGL